jgi:hypothetical protein
MWAKYVYDSGATAANIIDDVYLILGGETDKSNLSADANQTTTEIIATVASPWTNWDDVSATRKVLRCPVSDNGTEYKFVALNDVSSTYIRLTAFEDFDEVAHTGTKETTLNDKVGMSMLPTNGGTYYLSANATYFLIMHYYPTNDVWGNTTADHTYGSVGCFECSRAAPSLAIGDMPNWFITDTAQLWGDNDVTTRAIFYEGRDRTDTVQAPFDGNIGRLGRDNHFNRTSEYALTGLGGALALESIGDPTQYALEPIICAGSSAYGVSNSIDMQTYFGGVTEQCDIWFMPPSTVDVGSRVRIDGTTYFIFKAGMSTGTAGTAAGGKLAVPYG